MKDINDRVLELIRNLKMSKNQFANSIGTSSAMISKLTSKNANFGVDIFKKIIAVYPHLNYNWLLMGVGEMWLNLHTHNTHLDTHLSDSKHVPAYQQAKITNSLKKELKPFEEQDKINAKTVENTHEVSHVYIQNVHELLERDTPQLHDLKVKIDFVRQFQDVINDIEDEYIEGLRNALWRFQGNKFSLKQYQASVSKELEKLMPFKPAFDKLAKHINEFYEEMHHAGAEKVEFNQYIRESLKR